MAEASNVGPTNPTPPSSGPNNPTPINPNIPSFPQSGSNPKGAAPESFAQKAWGFDAQEAQKFISTLANTIITQIKHEDEEVKDASDKLKQAEQGEDE